MNKPKILVIGSGGLTQKQTEELSKIACLIVVDPIDRDTLKDQFIDDLTKLFADEENKGKRYKCLAADLFDTTMGKHDDHMEAIQPLVTKMFQEIQEITGEYIRDTPKLKAEPKTKGLAAQALDSLKKITLDPSCGPDSKIRAAELLLNFAPSMDEAVDDGKKPDFKTMGEYALGLEETIKQLKKRNQRLQEAETAYMAKASTRLRAETRCNEELSNQVAAYEKTNEELLEALAYRDQQLGAAFLKGKSPEVIAAEMEERLQRLIQKENECNDLVNKNQILKDRISNQRDTIIDLNKQLKEAENA